MNKYKEAFERIFGTSDYIEPLLTEDARFLNVVTRIINKKDYLTLKELVEKATPKRPRNLTRIPLVSERIYIGECPICNRTLTSENNYCGYCGQALDWGNEE